METTLNAIRNWTAAGHDPHALVGVIGSLDATTAAHLVNIASNEPIAAPSEQPVTQELKLPAQSKALPPPRKAPRVASLMIRVNREHIDAGDCRNPQQCAIAAAIKDEIPHVSFVAVRTNRITIVSRERDGGDGYKRYYAVPTKAAHAIVAFDRGEVVDPFSFKARLIETKKLRQTTPEQRRAYKEQQDRKRERLAEAGLPMPKYGKRLRVAGV
jgi:hypothetical protein